MYKMSFDTKMCDVLNEIRNNNVRFEMCAMCKKEGNIGSKSDSAKVSVIKNVSRVLIF